MVKLWNNKYKIFNNVKEVLHTELNRIKISIIIKDILLEGQYANLKIKIKMINKITTQSKI